MIVSINQPAYLPWLGYFHRIAVSDIHIVLDHVQFEKNSFINRNKVKTLNGWNWLTVPVKTKGKFGDLAINTIEINNNINWLTKHWRLISQNYGKASYFEMYSAFFEAVYSRNWVSLLDLCSEITEYLMGVLKIKTKILYSSQTNPKTTKSELVLELCRKFGASTYFSGALGRDYLDLQAFDREGIKVKFQNYYHPKYPQARGVNFEPYMSTIDLLFNCGPQSLEVLMEGQEGIEA